MPIILLLRMILETAVTDIQTAELIEKFKKSNSLFNSFLKNPAGILKTRIFSKTLGKGKLQDELNSFNKNLQTLTNLPVIHKKIMTHITNNNIAKLQHRGFLVICVSLFYKVLVQINSVFKFYHKMNNCCISILNRQCSFFCYIFNC